MTELHKPIEIAGQWLSLEEAATYLGLGKTALYTLAREAVYPPGKSARNGFLKERPWTRGYEQTSRWNRSF